jgi:hypothetical protein
MKLATQLHDRIKRLQFPRFWSLYPNKVSKRDAEKAWLKVIRTQADVDTCLRNTQAWAAHWDPAFTPYPATYLRRGQWEAPPPQAQPRNAPRLEPLPPTVEEKLEAIEDARHVGMEHLVECYRDDPDERVREALAYISDELGGGV